LLAACARKDADRGEFERVTLPGFSIELPHGEVQRTSKAPSAGKHEIKLPAPSLMDIALRRSVSSPQVSVEWMAQSFSREEWDGQMLPIFTQAVSRTVAGARLLRQEALDNGSRLDVIGVPGSPVAFGVVRCDEKFSVLVVHAHFRDPDREAEEIRGILRSVTCNVTDANRARVVAAVRLPPKFGRTMDRDVQMYRSLDGEQMTLNFTSGDIQREQKAYRNVMLALLSTSMGTQLRDSQLISLDTAAQHASGKTSLLRAEFSGTEKRLYVGSVYCADRNLTLISIWFSAQRDDGLARERQSQIGCPSESSTTLPSFETLVDEACKSGDRAACALHAAPDAS
jgi:hypothetical protein